MRRIRMNDAILYTRLDFEADPFLSKFVDHYQSFWFDWNRANNYMGEALFLGTDMVQSYESVQKLNTFLEYAAERGDIALEEEI